MAFDELKFVQWLKEMCGAHPQLSLGIGDDMAVVCAREGRILMASDMLLDGVHFNSRAHPWEAIGRKAVARNLSDCAAMAVRPLCITVSTVFPREIEQSAAQQLFSGIMEIATEFDLAIAGGDTARWDHPLAIDIAIMAEPYPGIEPIPRSGAKEVDGLYVAGYLGGSLLGRHMTFRPRVHEAHSLAAHFGARLHAMIDISDGLALDLWRMCQASGVGAQVEEDLVLAAAHADVRQASAADGKPLLEHVLGDGEDYELLLAIAGEVSDAPVSLHPIGRVVGTRELRMLHKDGQLRALEPAGYVHR
jgi:thiamine-monophosphate kinase